MPQRRTAGSVLWDVLLTFSSLILALTPTWIWLLAGSLLSPQGFWQRVFLAGIGIWILGGVQLILVIMWLGLYAAIWNR